MSSFAPRRTFFRGAKDDIRTQALSVAPVACYHCSQRRGPATRVQPMSAALPIAATLALALCISCPVAAEGRKPAATAAARTDPALDELLEPIRKKHDLPALAGAIVSSKGLVAVGAV